MPISTNRGESQTNSQILVTQNFIGQVVSTTKDSIVVAVKTSLDDCNMDEHITVKLNNKTSTPLSGILPKLDKSGKVVHGNKASLENGSYWIFRGNFFLGANSNNKENRILISQSVSFYENKTVLEESGMVLDGFFKIGPERTSSKTSNTYQNLHFYPNEVKFIEPRIENLKKEIGAILADSPFQNPSIALFIREKLRGTPAENKDHVRAFSAERAVCVIDLIGNTVVDNDGDNLNISYQGYPTVEDVIAKMRSINSEMIDFVNKENAKDYEFGLVVGGVFSLAKYLTASYVPKNIKIKQRNLVDESLMPSLNNSNGFFEGFALLKNSEYDDRIISSIGKIEPSIRYHGCALLPDLPLKDFPEYKMGLSSLVEESRVDRGNFFRANKSKDEINDAENTRDGERSDTIPF